MLPEINRLPVIGSLLVILQRHGLELLAVDDGHALHKLSGTSRQRRQDAKALIAGEHETHLITTAGRLDLLLADRPCGLVHDYTGHRLDAPVVEFSDHWAGLGWPTK